MTQADTRYLVEHSALPNALYSKGASLLKAMMDDEGRTMEKLYKLARGLHGFRTCPYDRSAFSLKFREYINAGSSVLIVEIKMPQPETSLSCRSAYLCYGDGKDSMLYITSELYDDNYVLYVQTKNNERLACSGTGKDEFDAVAKAYWDFTRDTGKEQITQIIITVPHVNA